MNRHIPGRRNAAFTLYELVIVLALVLLVGAMVASFLAFMNGFNERNAQTSLRVRELTMLREQTDMWFSYADSAGYAPSFTEGGVSAGNMYIACERAEDGSRFTFAYGGVREDIVLELENAYEMYFYEEGTAEADEAALLRFTVRLRVSGRAYACEVTYEG